MTAESIPVQLGSACPSVRLAGPADAVAGVQPAFVATPACTAEVSAVLRAAAALNLAVVPRGRGTRLHWGAPPVRCDLVVELTAMDQVIEHASGDLVATVQAGVTLDRLAEVLGLAGQRLALDPPVLDQPEDRRSDGERGALDLGTANGGTAGRGTVGGLIATGSAGPLRLRYGTPRDLLIGITVVRADGVITRAGGKVVKNVAGYDLGKLFAGSRGTLGVITEATFRLHPVPATTVYVTAECTAPAQVGPLLSAAMDSRLVPVAAEIDWPGASSPIRLGFALEGDAAGTAQRSAAMVDRLASTADRSRARTATADAVSTAPTASAASTASSDSLRPTGDAARLPMIAEVSQHAPAWWATGPAARSEGTVLQVAFWPGEAGHVLTEIRAAAAAARLDPAIGGSPAAAVLHLCTPPDANPDQVTVFVTGLRRALGQVAAASGGGSLTRKTDSPARASVIVLHAPAAVRAQLDMFGPVPALGLMRAVKAQFDPDARMAPGRFAGGI